MFNKSKPKSKPNAHGIRIGVAVSRYHSEITNSMCDAAIDAYVNAGGEKVDLIIIPVPGTFELTAACRAFANLDMDDQGDEDNPGVEAAVALGCLITGETTHDQYIAQAVTHGLTQITCDTGMPIAFGVLTCQSMEQARARSIDAAAAGGVNKGAEAMLAAIEMVNTLKSIGAIRETL